jgi:hypothetical protein
METMKNTQDFIFRYGGISAWCEHLKGQGDLYDRVVRGGTMKHEPVRRNADGIDVSYRHNKRMLLNLVTLLKLLSEKEQQ